MDHSCGQCGGALIFMGALGSLAWFRCRCCGSEESRSLDKHLQSILEDADGNGS